MFASHTIAQQLKDLLAHLQILKFNTVLILERTQIPFVQGSSCIKKKKNSREKLEVNEFKANELPLSVPLYQQSTL